MKFELIALLFRSFSVLANAETAVPDRTYFIETTGNKAMRESLLKELTAKPCFRLGDIEEGSTLTECYAFVPKTPQSEIHKESAYLFKIKLKEGAKSGRPRLMAVQGFKSDGKRMIRYFNAGNFSIPSEYQMKTNQADFSESNFIKQASATIIGLAFK